MTSLPALENAAWTTAGRPLPAAVLWDMDGTLVDTEPYWHEAERALVTEHGGVWGEEQARLLVGFSLIDSGHYLRRHAGVDLPAEQIVDILVARVIEQVRKHIEWRPGALRLLHELRDRGVPCALVTMSYRPLAEAVVGTLPAGLLTTLITGDEVTRGKPHPEPYLTAAASLGVDPADCLAIEDSPTGVASAEAAGSPVLAVEHLVPLPAGAGRIVIDTLGETTVDDLALAAFTLRRR